MSFRHFTFKQASESEYRGLVQNNPKGNVEAFAQGDKTNLDLFTKILKLGPSSSRVDNVTLNWENAEKDCTDFTIV